ncbi:MAG: hypothetical protein IPH72_34555 [Sandaracinaceae bacterium]|nr:hypothetical protein [Sandaracinaceae bacterium]
MKVLDFGLVKSMEKTPSDPTVTSDAGIAGTPLYMAPEVLSKAGAASARSDIYAPGAVRTSRWRRAISSLTVTPWR